LIGNSVLAPPNIWRKLDEAGDKRHPTRQELDEKKDLTEHLDPEDAEACHLEEEYQREREFDGRLQSPNARIS